MKKRGKVAETIDITSSKKARKASPRAIAYVDNLTKGMTKKDAALGAGYSESTAEHPGQAIESQSSVQQLLTDAGITHESLVNRLKLGIDANKLFGKDAIEYPDYATQLAYIKTCFRLLGVETEKPSAQINTQINMLQGSDIEAINDAFVKFLNKQFGTRKDAD